MAFRVELTFAYGNLVVFLHCFDVDKYKIGISYGKIIVKQKT